MKQINNVAEAAIEKRIDRTKLSHPNNRWATILWKGYLTGIYMEVPERVSHRDLVNLMKLLPRDGDEEQSVFFAAADTKEEREEAILDYHERMKDLDRWEAEENEK